jgi:hypothetical protein
VNINQFLLKLQDLIKPLKELTEKKHHILSKITLLMNLVKNKLKEIRKKVGYSGKTFDPKLFEKYVNSFEKKWIKCQNGKIGISKGLLMNKDFDSGVKNKKKIIQKLEVSIFIDGNLKREFRVKLIYLIKMR